MNKYRRIVTIIFCIFGYAGGGWAQDDGDYYILNEGDRIEVSIWGQADLGGERVILPDGSISFPLIGRLEAAGLTTERLGEDVKARLKDVVRDPIVTVSVTEVTGNRVFVLGQVRAPGSYVLTARMTVAQALSMAGGPLEFARTNRISIIRGQGESEERLRYNLEDVYDGDAPDLAIRAGDLIVVP